MALYKVSYVVPGKPGEGAILSQREAPEVGKLVTLHGQTYQVVEVIELWEHSNVVEKEPSGITETNASFISDQRTPQ